LFAALLSSISTSAGIAVVVTRSCIGVWDFMTGQVRGREGGETAAQLKFTLANSALGSIITHALVNEEGSCTLAAESGDVIYWDMAERKVIFQEKQPDVLQLFFYKNQTRSIAVSRLGPRGNYCSLVVSRSVPEGVSQWQFQYPFQVAATIPSRFQLPSGIQEHRDHP
jgi:hypothetical protein